MMWRYQDNIQSKVTRCITFFAERSKASVNALRRETSLKYEDALRIVLYLLELGYIQKVGDAGEEDIDEYDYALTYKGLKFFLEHSRLGESREKIGEVIKLHASNSVVLKHYDVFKTSGLDDYIVKRLQRGYRYDTSRGHLESIRYFQRPNNALVDAVDVLGLDYLTMEKDKVKKILGDDYETQVRLFEMLGEIPGLESIRPKYLDYVEDRTKHVLDNMDKWKMDLHARR